VTSTRTLATTVAVTVAVIDPDGRGVAHATARLNVPAKGSATTSLRLVVSSPRLWGPDSPSLYQARAVHTRAVHAPCTRRACSVHAPYVCRACAVRVPCMRRACAVRVRCVCGAHAVLGGGGERHPPQGTLAVAGAPQPRGGRHSGGGAGRGRPTCQ
jgi:hypothetical protein